MSTSIGRPVGTGFDQTEVAKLFRKRCRIYFTTGHFIAGDDNIPTGQAECLALYTGADPLFKPLGMMDKAIGSVKPLQNMLRTDFYNIPLDATVNFELNNVRVYPDMLTWLDTDEAKGELTLLFVPDGDDGSTFLALSGVGITPEGEISLGGEISKIKLTGEKPCNDITDVIVHKQLNLITGDDSLEPAITYATGNINLAWDAVALADDYQVWRTDDIDSSLTLMQTGATRTYSEALGAGPVFFQVIARMAGVAIAGSKLYGYYTIASTAAAPKYFSLPLMADDLDLDDYLDDALLTEEDIIQQDGPTGSNVATYYTETGWYVDGDMFPLETSFPFIYIPVGNSFILLKGYHDPQETAFEISEGSWANFSLNTARPVSLGLLRGDFATGDIIRDLVLGNANDAIYNAETGSWDGELKEIAPLGAYTFYRAGAGTLNFSYTPER